MQSNIIMQISKLNKLKPLALFSLSPENKTFLFFRCRNGIFFFILSLFIYLSLSLLCGGQSRKEYMCILQCAWCSDHAAVVDSVGRHWIATVATQTNTPIHSSCPVNSLTLIRDFQAFIFLYLRRYFFLHFNAVVVVVCCQNVGHPLPLINSLSIELCLFPSVCSFCVDLITHPGRFYIVKPNTRSRFAILLVLVSAQTRPTCSICPQYVSVCVCARRFILFLASQRRGLVDVWIFRANKII